MELTKTYLQYEVYGVMGTKNRVLNTIVYEDTNDFTINVENSNIQFKNFDSSTVFSLQGNFTHFIFIGFSSYNPAQWTVQEGEYIFCRN